MKKYEFSIQNLDCPNCARKLEEGLNSRNDLCNVVVNFNTCKLIYESDNDYSIEKINAIAKKYDSDILLTKEEHHHHEFHLSILIFGVIIGLLAYFINLDKNIKIVLYLISYGLLLYKIIIKAVKLLIKNRVIDENILITISCIGAFILGEYLEGIMVIGLYTIGKLLEEKAINKSRNEIKNILSLKSFYANIKKGENIEKVLVEEVKIGDILVVKKGEKVAVDGVILSGNSLIDTSMLTGESEKELIKVGDEILSGSINQGDVILVKASKEYHDSTVAKILNLLNDATNSKAKTETFVNKASKVYTPIVIILSILVITILPLIFNMSYSESIYRGLTFLVIACPCAIAISVPLSYFTGIGVSGKNGILIKGSNYLDNLANTKKIIFDKTGTLTNGEFSVDEIKIFDNSYTREEVIDIMCQGEFFSSHPIAKSILKLANKKIDASKVKKFKEIDGGISYEIDHKKIILGSSKVCNCEIEAILHLNIDGVHVASIMINDGIKDKTEDMIKYFKNNHIKTYMFTGDKKEIANAIGNKLGIDEIKCELLPTDKYELYEKIENNEITVFVGDGINDSLVLKRASIGISMGNIGSDIAIEASDIVIMNDDLDKIPQAIEISKYVKKIIKQNLIFALSVKVLVLLLSTLGLVNMWLAVFADTGVTLLTVLSTLRIIRKFK